ncbi:MAG: serine hydrolase domain-containing protein [Propionibacteriaceae bacterium]|nr:serine hydrolase domain-containing protein [Propionibacteriaceae bacterium]
MLKLAVTEPHRRWTPGDLLAHARERQQPVGAPGERFCYSDTGFVLLGLLLEAVTNTSYHRLIHERLFEPLGMARSFMPLLTKPAVGDDTIAPLFLGRTRVDGSEAMSIDWAGGGLAGTLEDHLGLILALRSGRVVSRESWEWATRPRHRFRSGMHYGAGTMAIRFNGFVPWLRGWPQPVGHAGITAAHLWHDPVHEADIVINFGSTKAMRASVVTLIEIVGLLRKLDKR